MHQINRAYPLRFEPVFRRYLWGGRRLASILGRKLGPGDDYAESWDVVDRGADQSIVADGPWRGRSLAELVAQQSGELFGRQPAPARFPLLLKYLDAQRDLSVQVHPDDARAARLEPPDLGKTEAWVIVAAEPGSVIYTGLKPGVDRRQFQQAVAAGRTVDCLHRWEPRVGDCIFIPAGVVHALGAGLLVAEIQQASDTTFRLYDWDRLDAHGRPRPLQVAEALEAIDYHCGPARAQVPQPTDRPHVRQLVSSDKFVLDRWSLDSAQLVGGDDRFHILSVLGGAVEVAGDPTGRPLKLGDTALIPSGCGPVAILPHGPADLLDIYLPWPAGVGAARG